MLTNVKKFGRLKLSLYICINILKVADNFYIKTEDGVKLNLDEVTDIEVLKNYIKAGIRSHIDTMEISVSPKNEIEKVRQMISILYEFMVLNDKRGVNMPEKLKTALNIYLIYGYNKESKKIVMNTLNLKDITDVNAINHKLRNLGLLVQDTGNSRISHLCSEFQGLQKFVNACKYKNKSALRFSWLS